MILGEPLEEYDYGPSFFNGQSKTRFHLAAADIFIYFSARSSKVPPSLDSHHLSAYRRLAHLKTTISDEMSIERVRLIPVTTSIQQSGHHGPLMAIISLHAHTSLPQTTIFHYTFISLHHCQHLSHLTIKQHVLHFSVRKPRISSMWEPRTMLLHSSFCHLLHGHIASQGASNLSPIRTWKATHRTLNDIMIKSVLIFNNHGNPRLTKFYQPIVRARTHAISFTDKKLKRRQEKKKIPSKV